MGTWYRPRTGSKRPDFRTVRSDRPPGYWHQPEDGVAMGDLEEYWTRNRTQFTSQWRRGFDDRVVGEYEETCARLDPEANPDAPAGELDSRRDEFFGALRDIEQWRFWEYVPQKEYRPERSLVGAQLLRRLPEYVTWKGRQAGRSDYGTRSGSDGIGGLGALELSMMDLSSVPDPDYAIPDEAKGWGKAGLPAYRGGHPHETEHEAAPGFVPDRTPPRPGRDYAIPDETPGVFEDDGPDF